MRFRNSADPVTALGKNRSAALTTAAASRGVSNALAERILQASWVCRGLDHVAYVLEGKQNLHLLLLHVSSYYEMSFSILLLLAFHVSHSRQSKCTDTPPIVVPITDVVIDNENSVRGALVTVGSPAQNLSWIPQM